MPQDHPSETDLAAFATSLSNENRWGVDDRLGTLNFITDEARTAALRSITSGRVVSCALPLEAPEESDRDITHGGARLKPVTVDVSIPGRENVLFASEQLELVFHGSDVTHLDSLAHVTLNGTGYNGSTGRGEHLSLDAAAERLVGRGVLVDVPRFRGVPWLDPGESIRPSEVDQILKAQGVSVLPGDMLLLNTGYGRRRATRGPDDPSAGRAGWDGACLPWFAERQVSLVGADTANDVKPSGYSNFAVPLHGIGLPRLGLWLLDNCDLYALATACEQERRWTFAFLIAPLRFSRGVTSSAVNPLALF